MKIRLMSILGVIVAGIIAVVIVISGHMATENQYSSNLAKARANAEKLIPYNAHHYYQEAFKVKCEDEEIFKEYLTQAELLGKDFHSAAIEEYIEKFPNSANAYELYCGLQYERGSYKTVIAVALEAREKGIATEQVKNWYTECFYMLINVKSEIEEAQSFLGDYARVKFGGLYGYLSTTGKFALAPVYKEASPMLGTSAAVFENDEWHMINNGGYTVARTDKPVDSMSILVGGKIAISVAGKYGYTNTSMQIPENLPYDYASTFKNGIAAVKKGEKWALINTNEEQITDYIFEDIILDEYDTCCNEGVIFAKKDGKYYMVNAQGGKITDQAFDDAKSFAGSGPAAICVSGKWGFADKSGKIVIEPQYEGANSFNIGLGAVCIDGAWGYINASGTIRIECQFEDCQPFAANGIAAVKEKGMWKYVRLLSYCD